MSALPRPSDASPIFPQTRWSLVAAVTAGGSPEAAEAAVEAICRAYWHPLYAFARRSGHPMHDAEDLTQEFFRRLLEKRWLADVDREKGRLRTFLVVALKNFMAKEWRRAFAEKRGGAQAAIPLDTDFAESRQAADPLAEGETERVFDRQWALTLLNLSLNRLREEFAASGRQNDFEALKECLTAARGAVDYAAVAARLGQSEGTARVAVHRLRKRFREVFREEIAQTVASGESLEDELRHLMAVL